jgi:3-phenylpropionate/trans-cinnamate dioxygenase ferredoxin subunit
VATYKCVPARLWLNILFMLLPASRRFKLNFRVRFKACMTMSDWVTVATSGELEPGCSRVVDLNGTAIAVFNLDGEYHAIEDMCTHDGGELAGGKVEGGWIECVRHGARFCIRTGAVVLGPAFAPVAKFPVRVESGVIQVRDDRWD